MPQCGNNNNNNNNKQHKQQRLRRLRATTKLVTERRAATSRALWRIISLQLSHVVADADVALSSTTTKSSSSSDAGGSCGAAGGQHGLKANQRSKFSNSTFFEAELSTAEWSWSCCTTTTPTTTETTTITHNNNKAATPLNNNRG